MEDKEKQSELLSPIFSLKNCFDELKTLDKFIPEPGKLYWPLYMIKKCYELGIKENDRIEVKLLRGIPSSVTGVVKFIDRNGIKLQTSSKRWFSNQIAYKAVRWMDVSSIKIVKSYQPEPENAPVDAKAPVTISVSAKLWAPFLNPRQVTNSIVVGKKNGTIITLPSTGIVKETPYMRAIDDEEHTVFECAIPANELHDIKYIAAVWTVAGTSDSRMQFVTMEYPTFQSANATNYHVSLETIPFASDVEYREVAPPVHEAVVSGTDCSFIEIGNDVMFVKSLQDKSKVPDLMMDLIAATTGMCDFENTKFRECTVRRNTYSKQGNSELDEITPEFIKRISFLA